MYNFIMFLLLSLFLFLSSCARPRSAEHSIVGFVEDMSIRKTFMYSKGKWSSLREPLVPATSHTLAEWDIYSVENTRADKDSSFSGWSGERSRPVIVTSLKKIKDPEEWISKVPDQIPHSILRDLRERYKAKITVFQNSGLEEKTLTRATKDSELVARKFFSNRQGSELLSININLVSGETAFCETEGDECAAEEASWYLKDQSGKWMFLTTASGLIGIVDVNGDGASEFIFWLQRYNQDGYELIDGATLEVVRSTWNYH
jgi:hypothetical protein